MTYGSLPARLAGLALVGGIALAACGGSSGGSSTVKTQSGGNGTTNAAATTAGVTTHSGPNGTYLTTAAGRTLYMFSADTGSTSKCSGACLSEWPAFTTGGKATASGGAKASMVGTTSRSGGTTQVTYAGHPLYMFAGDSSAGDMNGMGLNDFGGTWAAVSATGTAVTKAAAGGGSSPSPSSGGGGWA